MGTQLQDGPIDSLLGADLLVRGSDPVLNGSARFRPTPDPEPDRRSGSGLEFRTKPRQHYKEGGKALLEFHEVTKACFKPLGAP